MPREIRVPSLGGKRGECRGRYSTALVVLLSSWRLYPWFVGPGLGRLSSH